MPRANRLAYVSHGPILRLRAPRAPRTTRGVRDLGRDFANADLNTVLMLPILPTIFHEYNDIFIPLVEDLETELPNSIKIHEDKRSLM